MNSITIITIVVVALLTIIIFGLDWIAYNSCLKAYQLEISQGKHDKEIIEESKKKKKRGLLGLICSYAVLSLLLSVFVAGLIYKVKGENFTLNNQTALVIKSGSMSDFYDDEIALKYNNDTSLHFDVGDICIFEKVDELKIGDVYAYKYKNNIITHRLIDIHDAGYEFQGDNNGVSDYTYSGRLVQEENIIYHYTGKKIIGIGSVVLYAQSYFGIWSLVGMIGVTVSSEIVNYKIDKINKARGKKLGVNYGKKKK